MAVKPGRLFGCEDRRAGLIGDMPILSPRLVLPLRILFWLALALTLFMALDSKPPSILPANLWDKAQHAIAFFVLAGLAGLAYPRTALWRLGEHLSFVGALIEVLQAMPIVHRDCDIHDWIADTIAITIALLLIRLLRKA